MVLPVATTKVWGPWIGTPTVSVCGNKCSYWKSEVVCDRECMIMSLTFVLSKQLPTHHHSTVSIPTVTTHSSPVSIGAHLYTSFIICVASNQTDITMPTQSHWKDRIISAADTQKFHRIIASLSHNSCIGDCIPTVEDLLGDQLNTPWRVFLLYLPIFMFTNGGLFKQFKYHHIWLQLHFWVSICGLRQSLCIAGDSSEDLFQYPSQLRLSRLIMGQTLSPK